MLLLGYFWWPRISRRRGSHAVLLWATLSVAIYPALVAVSQDVEMVAFLPAISAIFQAGIDLVFFDEPMKTIPTQYSTTFVSIAQSAQNLTGVIAPMVGSSLATKVGVRLAIGASSSEQFAGFATFARRKKE